MGTLTGIRAEVHGIVQGVGFRPFVYRTAVSCGVQGDVRNAGGHVEIRVRGTGPAVERFLDRLVREAPPLARIDSVQTGPCDDPGEDGFRVRPSGGASAGGRDIPPDLATCAACVAELFDRADRRYRYPFINCTDCGPRATIIADLPYDRVRTAMSGFTMCALCAAEYADPANRRFHAEPVACSDCGPRLSWDRLHGEEALAAAVAAIGAGGLVAVKGIGGYQLVCDAADEAAVARLRLAKGRPRKPFAVMLPDLDGISLDEAERDLLTLPAAPIVLVPGTKVRVAAGVAPGLSEVGLFLPYSPLHHLLMRELAPPLVVTSGNRGDEPIAFEPAHARRVLGPFVDGILDHDRPILSRYDDSVARVMALGAVGGQKEPALGAVGGQKETAGRPSLVRRARGYAPATLPLPIEARVPLLAVGAQLKHTTTVAAGRRAMLGPHTGDLENADTFAAFERSVAQLSDLSGQSPQIVCHDLHPAYLSTQYARDRFPGERRIAVQHHHAHVVATAAEHGVAEPFIGIAYDGLGFGDDGTLWGGEVLLATYAGYRRLGRFGHAPLPGGAAAVRRPARMALGYLFGTSLDEHLATDLFARLDPREIAVVRRMVQRGVNAPLASSAGRLFDAVASLLGIADDSSYEGEAAILLEAAAAGAPEPRKALQWRLVERDGLLVYDCAATLRDALLRARDEPAGVVAAAFHTALAEVTVAFAELARARHGVPRVCLGGGVFANRRLTTATVAGLAGAGFEVYIGQQVPVNDGGISYGQAAVAAAHSVGR